MQKVYVLDSSVLLHDPQALYQFEDNEVVIPYAVLEELENKKGQPDNIGRAARDVIQTLDKLRIHGQLTQGIRLKSGGLLRIELNHSLPVGLPPASNLFLISNRILSLSLNLDHEEERPVILVTKDIAMRVKADALGLATEDYYNDKIFLPPVGDDIVSIALTDEEVNLLCQGGPISLKQAMQPNLCVKGVLSDNTNLPLVSSTTGSELIAAFGHKQLTWDIAPKNFEQNWAIAMLNNPNINLINLMGPAGTGKTLLALASGLEQTVNSAQYNRILCARPIIPFGNDIGYLPGEKEAKVRPYMQPIYDNLEFLLKPKREKGNDFEVESTIDLLIKKRQLEIEVLTYIRGRSIPNHFTIIDEAQNLTAHEVKTIITRAGEGTKIVLCGDPDQIDHPYLDKESNGMTYLTSRLKGQAFYGQIRLVCGERSKMATLAANLL